MRAFTEGAGRDAPVTRAIGRSGTQHRCAIGVVEGDSCTGLSTAAGDGWCGVAGDVVRIAYARVRAAGQHWGARSTRCSAVNCDRQAAGCSAHIARCVFHLGGQGVGTVCQCACRDRPVTRAIGCGCSQHSRAIGVIQRDSAARFSTRTAHGWGVVAGDVVGVACTAVRTCQHIETCWRVGGRGVNRD